MRFILDTHIFLWFVNDDPKLSDLLKDLIEDENNISYLSLASVWEMSIKYNLGKVKLDPDFDSFVLQEITTKKITLLNIELEHLKVNSILPFHHRDPFDRLIIAQSIVEDILILEKRKMS